MISSSKLYSCRGFLKAFNSYYYIITLKLNYLDLSHNNS